MRPRLILYWVVIVLTLFFNRCAKEETKPQQLLVNGNFENGNTVPTDRKDNHTGKRQTNQHEYNRVFYLPTQHYWRSLL
jgi:hypothetical protein